MMRFRLFVVLAIGGLALAGCQKSKESASGPYTPPDTTFSGGGDSPKSSGPSASKEPSSTPKGSRPDLAPEHESPKEKLPEPPKIAVEIAPPETKGWMKSDLSFSELGEKVGQTMRSLKGAYGEATLMADNGEMSGSVTSIIKIRSDKEFAIEYNLPFQPARINRMLGNASKGKAMLENGEWKRIPDRLPDDLVETWPMTFTKQIFTGLVAGQDSWKPYFEALAAGKGGFKANVEMRTILPAEGGLPQKYYRIIATRTSPKPEEIEARFDAVHFLPLAIRVKSVQKNGKKVEAQWQARWTWTKPLEDSDFAMPKAL